MTTEDEAREAADGTAVQVEAVDLGTVHFEAHPEVKLPSIMETKNVGENIDSAEGTLKILEDQVLVEAPSEVELPPEHNLNGRASTLNGHMDKEEKISNEQPHENDQEAELDETIAHQSNGISKEDVADSLSHGESTTEDNSLLKHEKDEEPRPSGDDQQDLDVTVDVDSVREDTLKTDSAIEQTDDGQQDQNQEPEKANEDTQPASTANNADVEVVAEEPTVLQTPVEPNLDDSGSVAGNINEKMETKEPNKADGVVHPDHKEGFPEETSTAERTDGAVKVEDQQSHQAYMMDADVVQEEMLKREETHVQEEVPNYEAHEPTTNAQETLNKESTEEIDDPMNENNEETVNQSNMEAPKETVSEFDNAMRAPPVNVQVQNHEPSEEMEHSEAVDTEAEKQQSSVAFEDAILEDQHNLSVTMDNDPVQEDTLKAIEQKDDGQQDQDREPEKTTEDTQPASMANIPDVEVVAEAPSGVQTPVKPNLENHAIPDTIDGNTETDEPAKAEGVVHLDHKESFLEDASIAEPAEDVVKIEDQQSQQADAVDADVVQEDVPKSEHADEPATQEVLNQESTEETDGPENENTEESAHQSNMAAPEQTTPENDTITVGLPVNIEVPNQELVEEIEDSEAVMQQSTVAFEEAIPEDQHNLGITMDGDTIQENTLEAIEQTEDVPRNHDLEQEKATENTPSAIMAEATETEAASQESNDCVSEKPSPEDHKIESETECDTQEVSITKSLEVIDGNKVIITEGSSGQSNMVSAGVSAQENNAFESEPTTDIQPVQEPEPEEINNTELAEVKETSHEMNTTVFQTPIEEDNPATIDLHESAREMSNIETTEVGTPHQSNAAQTEEQAPKGIESESQLPLEEMNDTEATEPKNISQGNVISTSRESAPDEFATEDKKSTEPDGDHQQEQDSTDFTETEADKPEGIASSSTLSTSEQSTSEENETATEPSSDTQTENEDPAEVTEGAENVKSNTALAEAVASEEHVETDATADASSVPELELEETKDAEPAGTEDIMASSDLAAENMGVETMGTEAVPRESQVETIKELTEDDTTEDETHNDDIQQTLGQDPNEVKETVFTSEDDTAVDNVTAEEPTCHSQEVDKSESTEETKGNTAENIAEVSNVVIVDEAVEEQNVLHDGDIAEMHMRELEPEETKSIEPVESEEASDQRNVVVFNDLAQEDTPESEMQQMESAKKTTETEGAAQESNDCVSEEPSPEDHKIESETDCDIQERNITESLEVIDGDKDTITGGISGQSNMVSAGESAQEKDVPESEPTADIQPVQESESEEIKNAELAEVKETSHEMNTTVIQTPIEEDNPTTIDLHESARELSNIEATEAGTPHQSDAAQSEEQAPEGIESEIQVTESELVEEMNDTEATEPPNMSQGNLISTSGESVPEEIATEDKTSTEPDGDHQQLQDQKSTDLMETEADKPEGIASSSTLSSFEQSTSEENETAMEPSTDTQVENSESAEVTEVAENVKSYTALAEAAAPEEHAETDATTDTSSVTEPELEENKDAEPAGTEDIMTSGDLPAKNMDMETIRTEAVARESHVKSINELTEDDTEPALELESFEDTKCTDTIEHPGEPHSSTSNEPTLIEENTTVTESDTQQVPNVISQEIKDSEDTKTEEFSDLSSFPTPEDADQESNLPRTEPTTDVQQEQELGSTEKTIDTESVGAEDHQQQGVSALEEPAVDSEPNVDDQQLHKDKVPEVKGNEAMEAEEVVQQNNIDNPHDATEEKSELRSDPDSYAQPAQHVELSRDSEDNQLVKADEQKHEDKGDAFAMEPLVEPEDIENSTKNRTEDTAEAEQTEHEEAPHVSEESTPSSMDMKVDKVKGKHEVTEEDADAKHDNKDEESAEKNDIVVTDSTNEQGETTDEIKNEELEPDLASSGQEASEPAPSNDDILENDPAAVTQNVESGEHSEDKECTDKVNDDVHTIQASEEEITGEINENREIRNEDNAINHDESQTKPEEEEASQLHSDEPCNTDAKIDDAITLGGEIIDGNASIKPRENEDIGENKGLDSTSEPFVESSAQNNIEQDLSSHQKVEDEKLSMAEQNDVDNEAASDMQEKADESASYINLTSQCQEEINTDDVQQLEIEENSSDKIDETISHEKTETSTTEAVTINESITNKASEADGGSSDGSLKTCNGTERDVDISSIITTSKDESVNENMEDHKLALPAQDENTPEQALYLEKTKREMPSSQKILPTEPEKNQIPNESNEEELQDENPIPNEKNEEDMKDAEIGDAQKDVEQDLPVSHFLMNLILGKKNGDADENPESEAERKHGETTEDNSCMLISKQEESMGSLSTENKVDDDLTFEQEKHDVKCSEEAHEMVKEQSDDLKLDNERSIHTDEESNKNTRDLEILAYQGSPEDKISGEVSSEEAARVSTKMEIRDTEISKLELDDKEVDTVCQEKTEASTKTENGSLNSNINDLTNTEASEEDTLDEGETGLSHESLPEDKSADAVSEKTPLLTESDMVDEKDLSRDAEETASALLSSEKDLASAKEDATTEPSIKATTSSDIQLECEVEKKEEEQHASMDTSEVSGEDAEISNDNVEKSTSSEVTSDEQAPQITEPVSDTQKSFVHEKEISEGSTCMDEKESSNLSTKGVENFQTAVEIQADGPNMQVNQDKKGEVADNKTTMEPEKLGKSDFEEHQETATERKSPEATDEGDKQLLIKKENMIKEQVVPRTVESHEQTVSIKSNEEQELFDSKVQERDLNVVSPREAYAAEENFVDVTKPEFSTDEEQSPKADAEEKIKDFTDGAAMKTEVPGATQKARKKQNLLSGVGSKVKQQLAKVKKAIVRKPGNTKPDSPKS